MELWTGCIAGALLEKDYLAKLKNAGFMDSSIEILRVYNTSEVMPVLHLLTQLEDRTTGHNFWRIAM